MAYRARITASELSLRQLNVTVEFIDQAGVLPPITTSYTPHGMTRGEFLRTVVKPELQTLNQLAPLKVDLDGDVQTARWFREVDIT